MALRRTPRTLVALLRPCRRSCRRAARQRSLDRDATCGSRFAGGQRRAGGGAGADRAGVGPLYARGAAVSRGVDPSPRPAPLERLRTPIRAQRRSQKVNVILQIHLSGAVADRRDTVACRCRPAVTYPTAGGCSGGAPSVARSAPPLPPSPPSFPARVANAGASLSPPSATNRAEHVSSCAQSHAPRRTAQTDGG